MYNQNTQQNINSNSELSLAEQIADKSNLNPFADNSDNHNTANSPTNESYPNLPNPNSQAEHSSEATPPIQQPFQPIITVSTNETLPETLSPFTVEYPASNCFTSVVNANNNTTNNAKKQSNTVAGQNASVSLLGFLRNNFHWFFLLILAVGFVLTPNIAERIVYSLNRGAERAKAEAAKELLASFPNSEQRIPWVVKKVAPSVVSIRVFTQPRMGDFGGVGIGTGVIVDSKETTTYILTNHHVVNKARLFAVQFSDGQTTSEVEVIGFDADTDLAVLRINQLHSPSIEWGDSGKINVGEQVVAIGNPFGLGNTVTSGIISSTERYNPSQTSSRSHEMLQTDAAINPGNSGGPLVNLNGELIGINTTIFSQNGGNQGIGFAIPSSLAKHVYNEIRDNGIIEHGWLGIIMMPTTEDFALSQGWNASRGVVVRDFSPFSPARDAGIKRKDVLVKWGDTEIRDPLHLSHLIVLSRAGQTETVELIRDGELKKIKIKLGKRPVSVNNPD
ncbi:MAG: trypsin-like peptidase domain-containing protein [Planctomycetaceae bacterium]|jgi:serine protease Do|nr:trypsin-like peptidase domain-containing protein [Planctomycetaceae bacterium]